MSKVRKARGAETPTADPALVIPVGSVDLRHAIRQPKPDFTRAYAPLPMTGETVAEFQQSYSLIDWDMLYFLGFTNYRDLSAYKAEHNPSSEHPHGLPIDQDRELLLRLMYAYPRPGMMFNGPNVKLLTAFVFNLTMTPNVKLLRRCMPFMAMVMGRDKVSGYRWGRSKKTEGDATNLSIRRLCAKVFSIQQAEGTVREMFWKCAFASLIARSVDVSKLVELLRECDVAIPVMPSVTGDEMSARASHDDDNDSGLSH